MEKTKVLLQKIAEEISTTDILFNVNNHSQNSIHEVVMVQCWNNTDENEEILRKVGNVLSPSGEALILGPASILFSMKHKRNRDYMVHNFHIKGVITLKNNVFQFPTIPMALIILDMKDGFSWFTSASSIDEVINLITKGTDMSESAKIFYTSSVDPSNFMPDFYNGTRQQINSYLDEYETKTLDEIAELFTGKSVPVEELGGNEGDFSYLRARNIIDGKIVTSEYVKNEYVDKYANQILYPGDILISKYFGERRIAKVQECNCPAIASNAFIVIRALEVPEDYLYNYFCGSVGKKLFHKQLDMIETGTTIPSINLRNIKELRIPIFDDATMFEMINIDKLDKNELNKLADYINLEVIGNRADQLALELFLSSGWNENEIVFGNKNFAINIGSGKKYIPDLVIKDNKDILANVEVMISPQLASPLRMERIAELQKYKDVPLFIFTNLNNFDLYLTRDNKKITVKTVPSKGYLLELIESEGK